jgi:hypothetical protein
MPLPPVPDAGGKLTLNAGLRTESEYIPTFNENVPDQYKKPIQFGFADKLAPRFGAVYDVFGDSSLKVFGSFGIYYDVMKLYMAEGAFGGFKWQTDYYTLDFADYRLIAANGLVSVSNDAEVASLPALYLDHRLAHPSFDTLQPDMSHASRSPSAPKEAVGRPVFSAAALEEAADDRGYPIIPVVSSIIRQPPQRLDHRPRNPAE